MRDLSLPLRFSHLKLLGQKSPYHFYHSTDDDLHSSAIERGRAVHALVLKNKKVIGYHEGKKRDPRSKEFQQFQADNPDAEIMTHADFEKVTAQATAILMHPMASRLISEGIPEETLFYTRSGVACRATPDLYSPGRLGFVADLKTSKTADPDEWGFPKEALRYAYHGQLAMQAEAVRETKKGDPYHHYIIASESAPPYVVTVFRFTPRCIQAGEALVTKWFEQYRVCRESNCWPAYTSAICEIDTPQESTLIFGDEDQDESAQAA